MNKVKEVDYLIIGCGMVGLSTAYQLLNRKISKKVICIDKEKQLEKLKIINELYLFKRYTLRLNIL